MNKIIKVKSLTKRYGQTVALNDVSFELDEKGFVFVNGISGSGKTTLMNLMAGLDMPSSGEIYYSDNNIFEYKNTDLDNYRNSDVGIVFQNFNLIDDISVEENLMLPLMIQNVSEIKKKELVEDALKFVGLQGYNNRKGYELSAGQKQRVAIARAIIKRPKIIFADEVTGNLDAKNTEQILRVFNNISKRCLVVLISHNSLSAKKYADRIITLDDGKIQSDIDNRQMKELYLESYKVYITGDNYSREVPLDQFDIKSDIKEIIDMTGTKNELYRFNAKIVREDIKEKMDCISEIFSVGIKKLSLGKIYHFAIDLIKKRIFRNIISICLCAFMAMLFFSAYAIGKNDYYDSLAAYIHENERNIYDVKEIIVYEEEKNEVYRGKEFYDKLTEMLGEDNILKKSHNSTLYYDDNLLSVDIYKNNAFFSEKNIEGRWPMKNSEIAIGKKFAEMDNLDIGTMISSDEDDYIIVGIFDDSCFGKDKCAVLSEVYDNDNQALNLQACNILKSVDIDEFINDIVTIGKTSSVSKENLIWGRMPERQSEIIVSKQLIQQCEMSIPDRIITKFRVRNIYDEKYNHIYDSFVNMFDYIGKNVEMVGVYDSEEHDERGDILIDDSLYVEIEEFIYKYLDYENLCINVSEDTASLIKNMKQNDIYINDDICLFVYEIQNFFDNIGNVMDLILICMLLMFIFIMVSFLSYSVKDCSKTVGIYKSLGFRNIDVAKIFALKNFIITIPAIVIANVGTYGVIYFLNQQLFKFVQNTDVKVFNLNDVNVVIMNAIVIVIAVLATIIPIFSIVKKETISLIIRDE